MSTSPSSITIEDIDALVSGATPQFSMQIKARVHAAIAALPANDAVRVYGEQHMQLLDAMALGTTRGTAGQGQPGIDAAGWDRIPSHPDAAGGIGRR